MRTQQKRLVESLLLNEHQQYEGYSKPFANAMYTRQSRNLPYKTKRMTDHYCTLCKNPQTGSFTISIAVRCIHRHRVENGWKTNRKCCWNHGLYKSRFKLGLSIDTIHDEICVVYRDKQKSFATGPRLVIVALHGLFSYLFSKIQFRLGISQCPLFRKTQVCSYQTSNINKIKPFI